MAARNAKRIEARRLKVARLFSEGRSQSAIARALGVSEPTVSRDVRAAYDLWRQERAEVARHLGDLTLERLEALQAAAWDAWRRSQQDAVHVTEHPDGSKTTTTTPQGGSAAYLNAIIKAIDRQCKLLGLYARREPQTCVPPPVVEVVVQHRSEIPTLDQLIERMDGRKLLGP